MTQPRAALPGSDRHELRPHTAHPAAHPDERHEVTVLTAANLTTDEYLAVRAFAAEHGLAVVQYDRHCRRIVLSGRTPNMEAAFGVELHHRDHESGSYCAHYGPVTVPADLLPLIEGVFGLDSRPVAKPHYRKLCEKKRRVAAAKAFAASMKSPMEFDGIPPDGLLESIRHEDALEAEAAAFKKPPGTFTPLDLAKLYNFPPGDGAGQCIALIELGGGYKVSDFQAYAKELGLNPFTVSAVLVDHAKNKTGSDADGEVMLDIEVAAAIAPHAKIVVYFTQNSDKGFLDAISAAIHDQHNKPSVISISWGSSESNYTAAAMNSMDKLFAEAANLGISVLVAAGDNGSSDGEPSGNHADFPASSVNVTAVGGTNLKVSGTTLTEVVWNETAKGEGAGGGAFSTHFPIPSWQKSVVPASATGRGVPDIAACADPETGYFVRVDGQDSIIGGTSAGAPLVAGLIARINQKTGKRLGSLNPTLYAHPSTCRDIIHGNNGAYSASIGWDAASGLGVIDGGKLLAAVS